MKKRADEVLYQDKKVQNAGIIEQLSDSKKYKISVKFPVFLDGEFILLYSESEND